MDLTDEQWQLIEPILATPAPARSTRGRPPEAPRAVLNGILWKLRTGANWDDLPPIYPSHQTCYRYYDAWKSSGALKAIFAALYKDLLMRGGLDVKLALDQGDIRFVKTAGKTRIRFASRLQNTWQASTAVLILRLATLKIR